MSLLCAAGHMESSLYVWRRCCDGVGVGDGNWACAAIFRFLLSQTHTLTIVSFSFFCRFLPVPVILLSSLHTISFVLLPHTPHTPMLAFSHARSLPLLLFLIHYSLATLLAPLSTLCSVLYSASLAFFHSCILLISLAFLFPLFGNCMCVLLSIRVLVRAALVFVLSPRVVVVAARD